MGRKDTAAWSIIHSNCKMLNMDEEGLRKRAMLLLKYYRRICWQTFDGAEDIRMEFEDFSSNGLDGALIYLESFAPDKEKDFFEMKIRRLFNSKWMIDLVDSAMRKVKDFPVGGEEYFEIISMKYLNRFNYTENEMLDALHMERSRYYDKKKEATMVFGLAFWGTAIPKYKRFLQAGGDPDADNQISVDDLLVEIGQ